MHNDTPFLSLFFVNLLSFQIFFLFIMQKGKIQIYSWQIQKTQCKLRTSSKQQTDDADE